MERNRKRTETICLRLTPETYKKVKIMAAYRGLTMANMFEQFINEMSEVKSEQ